MDSGGNGVVAFAPYCRTNWKGLADNRFRSKLAGRDHWGYVIDPDAPNHLSATFHSVVASVANVIVPPTTVGDEQAFGSGSAAFRRGRLL